MKVLLDECVPVQVRNALAGHEVFSAQQRGWAGIKNGDLLSLAEQAGFDLFVLADKNLRYQQNLKARRIAILERWTNHRPTLEKHFPLILQTAQAVPAGVYYQLERPE